MITPDFIEIGPNPTKINSTCPINLLIDYWIVKINTHDFAQDNIVLQ